MSVFIRICHDDNSYGDVKEHKTDTIEEAMTWVRDFEEKEHGSERRESLFKQEKYSNGVSYVQYGSGYHWVTFEGKDVFASTNPSIQ